MCKKKKKQKQEVIKVVFLVDNLPSVSSLLNIGRLDVLNKSPSICLYGLSADQRDLTMFCSVSNYICILTVKNHNFYAPPPKSGGVLCYTL